MNKSATSLTCAVGNLIDQRVRCGGHEPDFIGQIKRVSVATVVGNKDLAACWTILQYSKQSLLECLRVDADRHYD